MHNSRINHLFGNLFFDGVKLCRAAASLVASLSRSGFLAGFAKYAGIGGIGGICALYCYNHKQPAGGVLQKKNSSL